MKKHVLFSILMLVFLFNCSKNIDISTVKAQEVDGATLEKEVKGNFDEINVSSGIEAELIKSNSEKVVVFAPSGVMDKVLVEIRNGSLELQMKPGFHFKKHHDVTAKIYVKDFSELEANSAAKIFSKGKFSMKKLEINASSAGSIKGDFEAGEMSVDASSSGVFEGKIWADQLESEASSAGTINIEGNSQSVVVDANSSGSFNGKNFVCENGVSSASSGANIDLTVTKSLKADASSGAVINISKNNKNLKSVEVNESSGGSVQLSN